MLLTMMLPLTPPLVLLLILHVVTVLLLRFGAMVVAVGVAVVVGEVEVPEAAFDY